MSELSVNCTKCGRPMAICKDECGCKKRHECTCHKREANACIVNGIAPRCDTKAYIPWITLPDVGSFGNLSNTFVKVSNINSAYYLACDKTPIEVSSGIVELDDYDVEKNELELASKLAVINNDTLVYFNKNRQPIIFNTKESK